MCPQALMKLKKKLIKLHRVLGFHYFCSNKHRKPYCTNSKAQCAFEGRALSSQNEGLKLHDLGGCPSVTSCY